MRNYTRLQEGPVAHGLLGVYCSSFCVTRSVAAILVKMDLANIAHSSTVSSGYEV